MSSCCAHFNRPRPVAWFFFLCAFGLTFGLGTWQVERLSWKEGLIASITAANAEAPLTDLPSDKAALDPLQFRKVALTGRWLGDTEFHLTPRYFHDQFGYGIVTPLKLKDGRIVLINRGWVPGNKKLAKNRPETAVTGKVTLAGIIRTTAERSYFTPPNQPQKNIWFGRDISEMADYAKLENVLPITIDAVGEQHSAHLPVPSDGTIRLRNDHLSYILTWYGIAAGILVIFLVYHRKK